MATNASTIATQQRTLLGADRYRDEWTQADVDFLIEFTDEVTDGEIAEALGRTLWAVQSKQHELRQGRVATGTRRSTGRVALAYDRGYADVEALFA